MATAKKLKSGSWRCLIYEYTDDAGTRHYKSFTAPTKKEAEYLATAYKINTSVNKSSITFGKALENYIAFRNSILSPTTIKYYKSLEKGHLSTLKDKPIRDITQADIQSLINKISVKLSPKSVRNIHGLISAVLHSERPDFALYTALPKKVRSTYKMPSEADIMRLMKFVSGTDMEVPILLATFGPMRRGEICALNADHINGCEVHVEYSMALTPENTWTIKAPKTTSSNRKIMFPKFIIDKLPTSGKITELTPHQITDAFPRILDKASIPRFRFHDLRHYSASMLHAMGVPDKYIMERGGWATDSVLKSVYQHTIKEQSKEVTDKINAHFSDMQHKMQHTSN